MEEKKATVAKVFVGSPGDVAECHDAVFEIVNRLTRDDWPPKSLVVEGYGWDNTHYPKLVNKPPQARQVSMLMLITCFRRCANLFASRCLDSVRSCRDIGL